MMKIDMSNIYFLMLNDLRVLFNANYVQVWSSVHCHCYMLFALVFCLLLLYVQISFAVYSKVVWWNKKIYSGYRLQLYIIVKKKWISVMNSQLWLGNVRNLVYSYIYIWTAILKNSNLKWFLAQRTFFHVLGFVNTGS